MKQKPSMKGKTAWNKSQIDREKWYETRTKYEGKNGMKQRVKDQIYREKQHEIQAKYDGNKSNGVRTIDAISLVLVPIYRTSTCSFELLLLESSSDSHTFLFQTLIHRNFGQKRRFFAISTRVWRTDGPTDRRTDGWTDVPTDGWTVGRTDPLIEMRRRI